MLRILVTDDEQVLPFDGRQLHLPVAHKFGEPKIICCRHFTAAIVAWSGNVLSG
jgi:hypothetical protein